MAPHNPLGPVSTAACIPNFALQEYPIGEHTYPKNVMVKELIPVEDGFLVIPDKPGIGIKLADDAQEKAPPRWHGEINVRLHVDGSVVDQ